MWYPCPDSNRGKRFRKPLLYPPELQGHRYETGVEGVGAPLLAFYRGFSACSKRVWPLGFNALGMCARWPGDCDPALSIIPDAFCQSTLPPMTSGGRLFPGLILCREDMALQNARPPAPAWWACAGLALRTMCCPAPRSSPERSRHAFHGTRGRRCLLSLPPD